MADVLRRTPPIVYYTAVSVALLGIVVARALDTYQNFFAAAFALSHSNGSIMVMANMAALALYLFGRSLQFLFFGPLRPMEVERLYQRGGFFVTDFMLAFATFREAFGISSGVMVSILLFAKCFHWLLSDRVEAIDQLPYPGPSRMEHARLLALIFVLWIFDMILFTYTVDAVMRQGIGLRVLFAAEYAILMVNLTQCLLKYALSVVELRRAAAVGGAIAPPWEEKPIYGFYIELSTAFVELTIYLFYFIVMSIYHSIPIYAIRDVYVAGSLFFSRTIAFFRYKKAMRALDVFPTPTQQELDNKNDKTCIVCREELHVALPEGAEDNDTSNGPPKRLPCGHLFHRNCLRSWFERQLTCPTCRRRVDEQQGRAPGANGAAGVAGALPGNIVGDDVVRHQANAAGAANGQRRGAVNAPTGAQPTETPVAMREPLRFEGFYLQPGAFVPWVGGPLLPRDPTNPHSQPLSRSGFPQSQQQSQRPRHTPVSSANLGFANAAASSAAPTPPPVQSPPPSSTTTGASWAALTQASTPTRAPASNSAPAPIVSKTPNDTKAKSSDSENQEEATSSDDFSDVAEASTQARRRLMAEAIQRRLNVNSSRSDAAWSNGSGRTGMETIERAMEKAQAKYFTNPSDPSKAESSSRVSPLSPAPSLTRQATSTASAFPAQYHVRQDAPSFIPLYHAFHQQHYGPIIGTSRPWPLQRKTSPTEALPFPMPSLPTMASQFPQPQQYLLPGSLAGTPRKFVRPSTPQHPSSLSNASRQRSNSGMTPQRDVRREPSPSQDLSLQQLDQITRMQVEERLRVLENVKRMTQQCIEELMAVRGTMPPMTRTKSTEPRPPAEDVLAISESSTLVPTSSVPADQAAPGIPPSLPAEGLSLTEPNTPLIQEPTDLTVVSADTAVPKELDTSPDLEPEPTPEIVPVEEVATEGTADN